MAGNAVFAPRYANALASVVSTHGLDAVAIQHQLRDFGETLGSSSELREILNDPSIPGDQKLGVVDGLVERLGIMREARNFIAVIIDHQRLGAFNEILAAYDEVANAGSGITEAEITTSRDLNDDDRRQLEQQVASLAGSVVRIHYLLDPGLLGGAVVKIGATVYDGSLRTQLEQLKQTLVAV